MKVQERMVVVVVVVERSYGDGESEEGFASACVSVEAGSASTAATSGWFCSERRLREIVSGKAVPVRKNSIRILSIKASPWLLLLCTSGADAFFIKDGDGDVVSVSSDTDDPSVALLWFMNMLKIRRHSSAVVACVNSRCISFASVSVKKGIGGGSIIVGIVETSLWENDRTGETGGVCCGSERTSFVDCSFLAFSSTPFTWVVKGGFSCISVGTAVGVTGIGFEEVSLGEWISWWKLRDELEGKIDLSSL